MAVRGLLRPLPPHAVPFTGLDPTLATLRAQGLRLGIITNGGEAHQRSTIRALGLEQRIDQILISEAEGVRKPDTRIFQRALQRLEVAAKDAVYVGDHPEVDIEGARRAGLWSIWKRDPYWGGCDSADAVIDELSSLPSVIQSLSHRRSARQNSS